MPGFDAAPALAALCRHAAAEHPDAWGWDGERAEARRLGTAVHGDGEIEQTAPGRFGLGDEVARCLHGLPPAWRLAGLLSLAFAEDFAVVDGRDATIPWLAVALPSHWAPEDKVGRHFAAVHAPVADSELLRKAGDSLMRLVTGAERWERFVWNVTDQPRLHAHPAARRRPALAAHGGGRRLVAHRAADLHAGARATQAVFTIHVEVQRLADAIDTPARAAALHAAIASMSDAVLAYRGLTRGARAAAGLAGGAPVKTRPITPARIDFGAGAGEPPRSPDFDDLYHPRVGAAAQAQHVFLHGNGLPARWAGRAHFTILETGFGLGNNFLATWDAWRRDPARCERLFFVVDRTPSAARATTWRGPMPRRPGRRWRPQLLQAWPPLVPNLHPLDFDGGRVQLLLALGDVARAAAGAAAGGRRLLPGRLRAGTQPGDVAAAPAARRWVARPHPRPRPPPGAWRATLRAGLTTAGFEVQRARRHRRQARDHAWRAMRRASCRAGRRGAAPAPRPRAVVVGAGLAGAAAAQALAALGLAVTVLDRHAEPAAETSGNPAGLFHGTVNADDGTHARLFRAAALVAQRAYRAAVDAGVPGQRRRPAAAGHARRRRRRDAGHAAAPGPAAGLRAGARRRRGVGARRRAAAGAAAWFYPAAAGSRPPAWVRHALATPGVRFAGGAAVAALERHGSDWLLRDAGGRRGRAGRPSSCSPMPPTRRGCWRRWAAGAGRWRTAAARSRTWRAPARRAAAAAGGR